ncbi:TPA: hypothetical protein ACOEQR_001088, partial [Stenotrophomonas maltophilia]
ATPMFDHSFWILSIKWFVGLWIKECQQSFTTSLLKPVMPDLHFVHQSCSSASRARKRGSRWILLKARTLSHR